MLWWGESQICSLVLPHFTGEDTEDQTGKVIYSPKSFSQLVTDSA